jgi:hypothetical protein
MRDAATLSAAEPGSPEESEAFRCLQSRLPDQFRQIFPDPKAPRTVLIIPSLSLDQEVMSRISGVMHYEERFLCLLLLLRWPRTRVIYVTSTPIPESVIEYYLHLLPDVPTRQARRRLSLLSCDDPALRPLTAKILGRPDLLAQLDELIEDRSRAHMTCFNVTGLERSLAVRLGIPIYGCDPDLSHLGSKSDSRKLFKEAGVPVADGIEDLPDAAAVADALGELKGRNPGLRKAVVKLNEGFSGEGNAIFSFEGAPARSGLATWTGATLPAMAFEARDMTWEAYRAKIQEMGAVVEEYVEGRQKRSPSAQYRVDPLGQIETISTHDQVMGGNSDQIFLGCRFPADESYRLEIQAQGFKVAEALRQRGVLGRFGVDFVSVREGDRWRHYAIEVNLRKGGTTHPFLMLQFLTDGTYDPATGLFLTPSGQPRFYCASDNLESPSYRGLTPDDLVDIAVLNDLHFHGATQQGVVFHLLGALCEFGKLGAVCVGDTIDRAQALYEDTVAVLDREAIGGRCSHPGEAT